MSGSYSAVLTDIAAASRKFLAESDTYRGIMPPSGPAVPDGGEASVNDILRAVVDAGAALHMQIAAAIEQHGTKLQRAHDRYQQVEEGLQKLCTDLTSDAKLS